VKLKLAWNFRKIVWPKTRYSFNNHIFIKAGPRVRLTQALAMDFASRNTTIPVAKVLDVFFIKGVVYILEELVDGPVLEDV